MSALQEDAARFLSDLPVSAYAERPLEQVRRLALKYRTPLVLVLAYLVMRVVLAFVARVWTRARRVMGECGRVGPRRWNEMNKLLLGMALGGFLGIFDGLSALISAPETRPDIVQIVTGSTIKGVITGMIIGFVARKTRSLTSPSSWAPSSAWSWPSRSPT